MIVKVQRCVRPRDASIFIYNQSRTYNNEIMPPDPEILALMGKDIVVYFDMTFEAGKLKFNKRMPDQGW